MIEAAVRLARDQTCVMQQPAVLCAEQRRHWGAQNRLL